MEGAMSIHCNEGVFHTSLSGVILGFEQDTKWCHPQGIVNVVSLSLARKHFHITYNIQEGNVFSLQKTYGSYHELRESERVLYYLYTAYKKGAHMKFLLQSTLPEGVTPNQTTLLTTVGGQK